MAVNITIDQNQDIIIAVAHVPSAVNDKIICAIYENGNNVLNIATQNLGGASGDVVIKAGIGYDISVPLVKSQKLSINDLTYKVYKIIDGSPSTTVQDGSITNTPLTGADISSADHTTIDTPFELTGVTPIADCQNKNNFYIDLTGDTTISFTNFSDGNIKSCKVNNAGTNDHSVDFISAGLTIIWPDGSQPAQSVGQTDIYSFQRFGDKIYATVLANFDN